MPEFLRYEDKNILTYPCKGEQYAFVYKDENAHQVIRITGKFMMDPRLSFDPIDAAVLLNVVKARIQETQQEIADAESDGFETVRMPNPRRF